MEHRSWAWRVRRSVGTAVMTAVLAGIAAPAFADTTKSPAKSPAPSTSPTAASPLIQDGIARALAAASPVYVATSAPAPAKAAAQGTRSSNGFLRSRTGAIVLAVFAVGTGYAIYSAKEDRIRGRNR